MTDIKWELSENGLDLKSAKEHLHMGPDGMVLHLRNLTAEEREFVEQNRDALASVWGINIIIEEDNNG